MKVTWQQLFYPEKPQIITIAGIGRVLVAAHDFSVPNPEDFDIVLVDNKPLSDWKIGHWESQGQIVDPTSGDG